MKIPFSPPYIDANVENEVLASLRSGWITTGPKVKELEAKTAELASVSNVLCVNSATSGMMLALHWFGIKPGDEVIIPAYTYCATALVVKHLGAIPVIVDVKDDFNIDPNKIREAFTERTKAVIPVDFGGWPCDYEAIRDIVNESQKLFISEGDMQEKMGRALIMADAAHSIGSIYRDAPAASFADISVFSFHAVKNVTTAEGGAICINLPKQFSNEEIYSTLRLWSLNGQTKDAFTKSQGGSWRYDIVYPGFKINMPDICAAIGLAQIKMYKSDLLKERKRIFDLYESLFHEKEWAISPPGKSNEKESSYHLYALRLSDDKLDMRDEIIKLAAERGVSLNVHFIPLSELSYFKSLGYSSENYPQAIDNFNREVSLPIYPQLSDEECRYIFETISDIVER